jgi:hypothetical protein
MRRVLSLVPMLALAAALAACDKHDSAANDARSLGRDVNHSVADVGHDPAVRQAEAEFRQATRDAGHDLHKAADEAKNALRDLTHDTHHASNATTERDR